MVFEVINIFQNVWQLKHVRKHKVIDYIYIKAIHFDKNIVAKTK